MQMAEPSQMLQAGPGAISSGRPGDRQEGYADHQGAITIYQPIVHDNWADFELSCIERSLNVITQYTSQHSRVVVMFFVEPDCKSF